MVWRSCFTINWCRVDDAEWARYKGLAVPEGAEGPKRESRGPAAQEATRQSWSDKIIISQDMQVTAQTRGCASTMCGQQWHRDNSREA
jgi:hypothetical protein